MLLTGKEFEKAKEYWQDQLSGQLEEIQLLRDLTPGKGHGSVDTDLEIQIKNQLADQLIRIAKNAELSMYVILLAALKILLYKYTGQNDLVTASPVFDKMSQEYNKWLLLRDLLDPQTTFKDFLFKVKQTAAQAYKNQHYPVRRLLEYLNIGKDISLFRVILLLESIQEKEFITDIIHEYETDIMFLIDRKKDRTGLQGNIKYNSSLYKQETIQLLAKRYIFILTQVLNNLNIEIARIRLADEEEKRRLLHEFNATPVEYPSGKTIHELYQEQVERIPDHIALAGQISNGEEHGRQNGGMHLSYKELNKKAGQLASLLKEKGVRPDSIVALKMERSFDIIIGKLGILKASGAYLPIDPLHPRDRIDYMLKDSSAKILLTRQEISDSSFYSPATLPPFYPSTLPSFHLHLPPAPATSLAYVIYTSGTTGRPKGVLITHGSFVNLVYYHREVFGENSRFRMSQVAGVGFDAMAFETWPCLLSGATLHIVDNETRIDPPAMKEWLVKNAITISFQPTMMAEQLLKEEWSPGSTSLQALRTAGEKLAVHPRHAYPFRLYNLYGPTEDTVWTTWAEVPVKPESEREPLIGKPTANKQVYIIGPGNHPQPTGVPGELSISGRGLARGYLNRPELTAERFEKNPIEKGKRMYRTGDLARWQPGGSLEFLGRIDTQVKIRGCRVELKEIENQLSRHPQVRQTIVTINENKNRDKYLCAYIVPNRDKDVDLAGVSLTVKEIRDFLSPSLPEYMIPNYFMEISEIPLTTNGKVDRKSLPEPKLEAGSNYIPPGSEVEEKLVEIWSEVLSAEKKVIGIEDNFFELGGHSLRATILVTRIHKAFNVSIPLTRLFKNPTIRALATYIGKAAKDRYISLQSTEKKEFYPLSAAQKRLYLTQQLDPGSTTYNMLTVLRLEEKLDKDRIRGAIKKLLDRHEILRTSIRLIDGVPFQVIHQQVELEIEYHDITTNERRQMTEEKTNAYLSSVIRPLSSGFIRPFDLSCAPLLRIGLLKTNENQHLLAADMHHIITDATSIEIMQRDLERFYKGEKLGELRLQYKDFSQWQTRKIISGEMKKQEEYWKKEFEAKPPALEIPIDYPRTGETSREGKRTRFPITHEETKKLKELAIKENATMFMVTLSLLNILLYKITRQQDIVVGTFPAGRRHGDLEDIMGFFINALVLRNYPRAEKTFIRFLREVRKKTMEAFDNQDYQFEDLVDQLKIEREPGRNPLFDIVFSFRSQDNPEPPLSSPENREKEKENTAARFDLIFTGTEAAGGIYFSITYRTRLFKKETIEKFIQYFMKIVSAVCTDESIQLKDIKVADDLEAAVSDIYDTVETKFEF